MEIQLSVIINFMSSKDTDERRTLNSNSDNIATLIGNKTDKIIQEFFGSLL